MAADPRKDKQHMPDPQPNPLPTPNALSTLLQKTGTISPDAFSISSEGGKAEATYLIGSEFYVPPS